MHFIAAEERKQWDSWRQDTGCRKWNSNRGLGARYIVCHLQRNGHFGVSAHRTTFCTYHQRLTYDLMVYGFLVRLFSPSALAFFPGPLCGEQSGLQKWWWWKTCPRPFRLSHLFCKSIQIRNALWTSELWTTHWFGQLQRPNFFICNQLEFGVVFILRIDRFWPFSLPSLILQNTFEELKWQSDVSKFLHQPV